MPADSRQVLGLMASACGDISPRFVEEIARPAAERGWRLAVTLTPTAARWLEASGDIAKIQALTDLPVRSALRLPDEPRPHPDPDVFLFAPASANSVAKLALGIADTQALTVLGDVIGLPAKRITVGCRTRSTRPLHPAWNGHLTALRDAGVEVFDLADYPLWTSLVDLLPR